MKDYTEEAEKLAEAFQRALKFEDVSLEKAKSMAFDKTKEMCRNK